MSESQPVENQDSQTSSNFSMWVICLLGIMLAAAMGLWLVEKGKVKRAYAEIQKGNLYISSQQQDMQRINGMLEGKDIAWIDPASLPKEKHKFDGNEVEVILVDEFFAKKQGLKPGDIILVTPERLGPVAR